MSYRKADIYVHETKAGILEETEIGYRFEYDSDYISQKNGEPVSLTLPLQDEPYESQGLFCTRFSSDRMFNTRSFSVLFSLII
jgi:serine/threonine-protein kinase HipA